jgi:Fe-Mn family superoxide dismutase
MAFELPDLPYDYDALEPHIDKNTMEIHYSKHHAGYVRKLNNAAEEAGLDGSTIEDLVKLLKNVSNHPTGIRNNGGGHYNHSLFWQVMSPNGGGEPGGELADAINDKFGSFSDFQEQFTNAAKGRFGSGWAWLIVQDGKLAITDTPNQDNPLMDVADDNGTPILGIDVWEHAYYLNYQNKRPEYIKQWWNVVNWEEVAKRYERVKEGATV